ncbi:hypothetical protein C7B76_22735 [filamentous cyanobacterium CCP2]|nr:hypothetical protein C7B76_22735 [filamentous cyanobacterium CCP2]
MNFWRREFVKTTKSVLLDNGFYCPLKSYLSILISSLQGILLQYDFSVVLEIFARKVVFSPLKNQF